MISIAICDDSSSVLKSLKKNIQDYAKKNNKGIRVFSFHDGSELIENYSGKFDIIFLDIKMPKMNGMEAAKKNKRKRFKSDYYFFDIFSSICFGGI